MPTMIDIDDGLLDAAMIVTGLATKEAAVEQALRLLIERHRRKNAIADLAGIGWEGDLEETVVDSSNLDPCICAG